MRCGLTELTRLMGVRIGDLARDGEGAVELAAHAHDVRAVGHRLTQLAERNVALRHEDDATQPRCCCVGGGGGRGVAGRGTKNGLVACLQRFGDCHDHAAVLEGARGVAALQLEEEPPNARLLLNCA